MQEKLSTATGCTIRAALISLTLPWPPTLQCHSQFNQCHQVIFIMVSSIVLNTFVSPPSSLPSPPYLPPVLHIKSLFLLSLPSFSSLLLPPLSLSLSLSLPSSSPSPLLHSSSNSPIPLLSSPSFLSPSLLLPLPLSLSPLSSAISCFLPLSSPSPLLPPLPSPLPLSLPSPLLPLFSPLSSPPSFLSPLLSSLFLLPSSSSSPSFSSPLSSPLFSLPSPLLPLFSPLSSPPSFLSPLLSSLFSLPSLLTLFSPLSPPSFLSPLLSSLFSLPSPSLFSPPLSPFLPLISHPLFPHLDTKLSRDSRNGDGGLEAVTSTIHATFGEPIGGRLRMDSSRQPMGGHVTHGQETRLPLTSSSARRRKHSQLSQFKKRINNFSGTFLSTQPCSFAFALSAVFMYEEDP
ncbi:hypothetical protein C7M84_001679 [Penaeus vannamei]|uniref:Uncharacterized protein n=1 Tax=Penaeus vannamei TaxID=6689 RepID=A0A423TT22_PENVA|nr:hypothetical protein C7M84_001679 [Penaeus vannamei]